MMLMISCLSAFNRKLSLGLNGSGTESTNWPKQEIQSYFPLRNQLVTGLFVYCDLFITAPSQADWFWFLKIFFEGTETFRIKFLLLFDLFEENLISRSNNCIWFLSSLRKVKLHRNVSRLQVSCVAVWSLRKTVWAQRWSWLKWQLTSTTRTWVWTNNCTTSTRRKASCYSRETVFSAVCFRDNLMLLSQLHF